jgi:two-component system, chemotaxis family, CheB/CheR fusion protein
MRESAPGRRTSRSSMLRSSVWLKFGFPIDCRDDLWEKSLMHPTDLEPELGTAGDASAQAAQSDSALPKFSVVGIGASAGGLKALQAFFGALPASTGMAFVVIMHLNPERESILAELLQAYTSMPVRQVRDHLEIPIQPDHVYVVAPAKQLLVTDSHLAASEFEEPRGQRTPIDAFLRSLTAVHRDAVGILLSGGGTDGILGMKQIKEYGGLLMVQDPDEAEFDSMPRNAIATGLVDIVGPVRELAQKLVTLRQAKVQTSMDPDALTSLDQATIRHILTQVRARTGHDFNHYKLATILRRIGRRMQVTGTRTLNGYLSMLRHNTAEAVALFNDLLISVTNFFRDSETWQTLPKQVIPTLFAGKGKDDTVRVWSVGCATGEEAYSLAMLLLEHASTLAEAPRLQIFATDIDDNALLTARNGCYPEAIQLDVSPERLQRFFVKEGDMYRVRRELRDVVLFTNHSILRDPPFLHIDLISCRNLLIYLQRSMQEKVFEIFHYALRRGAGAEDQREDVQPGYLFLGSAESPESITDLFRPLDKRSNLYQALPSAKRVPYIPSLPLLAPRSRLPVKLPVSASRPLPMADTAPWQRWEALSPPAILVDADQNVVYLSDTAGTYLRPPGGRLTSNVVRLARPELQAALRLALFDAFEGNRATVSGPIHADLERGRMLYLAVRPHQNSNGTRLALIVFLEDEGSGTEAGLQQGGEAGRPRRAPGDGAQAQRLEWQLQESEERLRVMLEDYEAANEELRAANEELQSMNEEYRSTTEELETNREELQSVNEELEAVNNELQHKLEEISQAHSDLENLMAATDIATLFIDCSLHIQRYTPSINAIFNVMASDRGRPINHFNFHLEYDNLGVDARHVLETLAHVEREVRGHDGSWFLVRLRPYRSVHNQIEGVVITFVDITRIKAVEEELRQLAQTLEERVQERTHQIQELASQLTLAEHAERHRISQVLHDDLQQHLYALQMQLFSVRSLMQAGQSAESLAELAKVEKMLPHALVITRRLSIDLSPPVLANEGLGKALAWLAPQMQSQFGLTVTVEAKNDLPTPGDDLRVLLFQIVRELLFNIVKHADVARATVSLAYKAGILHIDVSDDGSGFDASTFLSDQELASGQGLVTVRRRLQLFGGDIAIYSSPGSGTRVAITVPLPAADEPGIK